jgi:FkbM family methyltransferase
MGFFTEIKRLSIRFGFYRPTRWLSRRLRPSRQTSFDNDVSFYRDLLPAGGLAFDVGANIGEKSEALLAAGLRVVAFEPNPDVIPELLSRCQPSPNWTLIQVALSKNPGIASFYARTSHESSGFIPDWGGSPAHLYHVPVLNLDLAIAHFGVPDFCKIDVEGWELEVLSGLTQKPTILSFEFHLTEANIAQTKLCLDFLRQLGYTRANLAPAESTEFFHLTWIAIAELQEGFPGRYQAMSDLVYGDIYVCVCSGRHSPS